MNLRNEADKALVSAFEIIICRIVNSALESGDEEVIRGLATKLKGLKTTYEKVEAALDEL
jgi:hypothetical protein